MNTEDLECSDYGRWPAGPKKRRAQLLLLFASIAIELCAAEGLYLAAKVIFGL